MSNVQIAINWVNQAIQYANAGGIVGFPMFEGATKHDVRTIEAAIIKNPRVKTVTINKRICAVNLK